jgi:CTP synthase (UTP-ammonia lyase)
MRKTKVENQTQPSKKMAKVETKPKRERKPKAVEPVVEVKPKRGRKSKAVEVKVEKVKENKGGIKMKKPPVPKKENAKAGKVKPVKLVRKKREPKPIKLNKRYARIVKLKEGKFSMDYLIGRMVKVLDRSTEKMLYCIVQHPGYEGLEMAFHPSEVEFIEKLKKGELENV